tara:strand:- start:467 stop:1330 length:864 start_codon:yes stop_codon:yes gene_type:complete
MRNLKIKSHCKINLFLKVVKKLDTGYHDIISLITFCGLYDVITISKIKEPRDKVSFSGNFKQGINLKYNTVTRVLSLLRKNKLIKNKNFRINIKKNIPHGSGLGGGSSNAAYLLKNLNSKLHLNLTKKKIVKLARSIGFDVPISLEKKNTYLIGKGGSLLRIKKNFRLNLLVVYPNLIFSTKEIYKKNRTMTRFKNYFPFINKNKEKLINWLKNQNNDLEEAAIKLNPRIRQVINYIRSQKGCHFSRITGSGSACIGIFSNMKNAVYAKKLVKIKYPKYWVAVSKTI